MFDPQPPGPRSKLEAATALVYSEISILLTRLEDLQANLTSADAGLGKKIASLTDEANRHEAMLNERIGAMRLTTEREKEGLAVFIEKRATDFVALATDGQADAMTKASREIFQREVQPGLDKLIAAVGRSRAYASAPSPLMRLMEFMVVALLGGCAGALTTLLIVDYVRGVA
jgi:hypothetical protein